MQVYEPQATWTPSPPLLPVEPPASTHKATSSRGKRLMAAGLLALGMIAGGTAIVSAASPDPSASTAPNASGGTSSGGTTTPGYNAANCPNM